MTCNTWTDGEILLLLGEVAIERDDHRLRTEASFQPLGRPLDLCLARQEGEDRSCIAPMGLDNRPRDTVLDAFARRTVAVADVDRKAAPLADDHRRMVQEIRHPLDVERCRHHHDPQVVAQSGLHVECERQAEIRIQRPLMEFVEQDGGDTFQLGIIEHHSRKDALRHHLDPGAGRDPRVQPHPVADAVTDRIAAQFRHPPRRRPCGKPPGLDKDDPAAHPVLIEEAQGNNCRLAGSRGRREDRPRSVGEGCQELGNCLMDREGRHAVDGLIAPAMRWHQAGNLPVAGNGYIVFTLGIRAGRFRIKASVASGCGDRKGLPHVISRSSPQKK
ncbi:protein of unknown function [Pseudorhizobium banfieldiae]|uniref:Uncharacterized protein n=1 Tax=Pseudorhizobium banfieldiae TaxID=1125847 RepID=L0NL31_9HYPH|nr:protein of unknown function [Pseudorhizobium banfieldiae]